MNVIERYLKVNQYTRPGKNLGECKGIIMHWVGKPMQKAIDVINFFEVDCIANKHYSSAHYVVDLTGEIYHIVPDNEVSYHCGTLQPDPKSGLVYTDWARQKFGRYAQSPDINSPNNCTIGIELCVKDINGNFTLDTYAAAIDLTIHLLNKTKLNVEDIGTHHLVTGWKD